MASRAIQDTVSISDDYDILLEDHPQGMMIVRAMQSVDALMKTLKYYKHQQTRKTCQYHLVAIPNFTLEQLEYLESHKRAITHTRIAYLRYEEVLFCHLVPATPHQYIVDEIAKKVRSWFRGLGLHLSQFGFSDQPKRSFFSNFGTFTLRRQPDALFVPPREEGCTDHDDEWPTMIIETAFDCPATRQYLEANVNWWMEQSRGVTKVILLMYIDVREPRSIKLERWVHEYSASSRQWHTHLQRPEDLPVPVHPIKEQTILITDDEVENGPLQLPFATLMERPIQKPHETDLVLDDDFLCYLMTRFDGKDGRRNCPGWFMD